MSKTIVLDGPSENLRIPYKEALNGEQYDVVANGDGYSLVLAGAGSGKTRTVVYRVAWLLEHGVSPKEILLVTFTNKAAKEMMHRLSELLGAPAPIDGGTFHSLCNRWLRRIGPSCGREPNFTILDQDDSKDLISTIAKAHGGADKANGRPAAAVVQSLISFSRNAMSSVRDLVMERYPRFRPQIEWLETIEMEYETRKRMSNVVDFDDLLVITLKWLQANPDNARSFAERYRYVLVDEFQDTNKIQSQLVAALSGFHKNLLVVGDDAQSIYSFRAAEIKNILQFAQSYEGGKTFRLETNYRSTPEIINIANDVIAGNSEQLQKRLVSACPSGEKPTVIAAADGSQEAHAIAKVIEKARAAGDSLSSIAVLFRAAFHSQALEFELTRRGIAYEFRGGTRFFERAHVKDLLAILRIVSNPSDQVSWQRFLLALPGVGPAAAEKIVSSGFAENVQGLAAKPATSYRAALGWLLPIREESALASPDAIIKKINDAWFDGYLQDNYPDANDRAEDISQLMTLAAQYADVAAFLSEMTLQEGLMSDTEGKGGADEGDRMVLSTIHQAKGLEWKTVFVINLTDGAFPSQKAMAEPNGVSEERRLFYVAVTRARENLYLSYPRMGSGNAFYVSTKSMFLRDLPPDLYEEANLEIPSSSYGHVAASRAAVKKSGWGNETYEEDDGGWDSAGVPKAPLVHNKTKPTSYLDF